jgi:hypothetical protein
MNSEVESIYDQYVLNLQKTSPKVDANLLHRVMYLERKLSSEYVKEPQVTLLIEYKSDVDMDKKLYDLRENFSLEAEHTDEHNILLAMSRMNLDKIQQIASDEDIVKISGKASPIIRS